MTASMTCECNALYTGDACQFCEPAARRAGAVCVPTIALRIASGAAWYARFWVWIAVALVALLLAAAALWKCRRRRGIAAARPSVAPGASTARARKRGDNDEALLAEYRSSTSPRVATGGNEVPVVGSAEFRLR